MSMTPKRFKTCWTIGSVKGEPTACLERPPADTRPSLGSWQNRDSATGPEDIRCGGRNLGTCFDEISSDSERGDQKPVFIGTPVPGRHHQGRMQTRLSARSSGFVESVGSGGGSDSELSPVTPEIKTEIPSLKLRLVREEDAEELSLRVDQNREHLRQWAPWVDGTKSTTDHVEVHSRCLECAVAGTAIPLRPSLNGEIVGMVAFNSIEKMNRCATMGYWLAKSQTGRGLMTAAAKR